MTTVRAAIPADLAWVTHSWLASFADSEFAMLSTPRDVIHVDMCETCGSARVKRYQGMACAGKEYWSRHRALVERIISRSTLMVADTDGLLDGFACLEWYGDVPVVHYVYVRLSARGTGVAKALLHGLDPYTLVKYSHRSRGLKAPRLPSKFRYDVYEMMRSA